MNSTCGQCLNLATICLTGTVEGSPCTFYCDYHNPWKFRTANEIELEKEVKRLKECLEMIDAAVERRNLSLDPWHSDNDYFELIGMEVEAVLGK